MLSCASSLTVVDAFIFFVVRLDLNKRIFVPAIKLPDEEGALWVEVYDYVSAGDGK